MTFTTLKQRVPVIPVASAPDDTDKRDKPCDAVGYEVDFLVDLTGTRVFSKVAVRSSDPGMLCSTVHTVRTPSQSPHHSPVR